jgi:hypothetical protein
MAGGDDSGNGGGRRGGCDSAASGFGDGAPPECSRTASGFGDDGSGGGDESRRVAARSSASLAVDSKSTLTLRRAVCGDDAPERADPARAMLFDERNTTGGGALGTIGGGALGTGGVRLGGPDRGGDRDIVSAAFAANTDVAFGSTGRRSSLPESLPLPLSSSLVWL